MRPDLKPTAHYFFFIFTTPTLAATTPPKVWYGHLKLRRMRPRSAELLAILPSHTRRLSKRFTPRLPAFSFAVALGVSTPSRLLIHQRGYFKKSCTTRMNSFLRLRMSANFLLALVSIGCDLNTARDAASRSPLLETPGD